MKVCIIGASGKLGQYLVEHSLNRGYQVVGVCREESVEKLNRFRDKMEIIPGRTNDRDIIKKAVAGCEGVLTVLVPWGTDNYSSGTARAVLDFAEPDARLVFSCGWHVSRDNRDIYRPGFQMMVRIFGWFGRLFGVVDINDQLEAARRIFNSDTRWTVVRGSDLEEGESEGLPVWSRHVGDAVLKSNITRRIDFALFMVEALTDDTLIREAPAIVSRKSEFAVAHAMEV